MRISDWSSDVCSSDLELVRRLPAEPRLPDADRPPPPGSPAARALRQRDDLARRRRGGVPQDGAWRGAPVGGGDLMAITRVVTSGIFSLDGGDYEVDRSEERRVGEECVSKCKARWSTYN